MKKEKIKKYYLYSPTHPIKRIISFAFFVALYLLPAICVFLFTYYVMFHKWWCIFFGLPIAILIIFVVRCYFFDYFYVSPDGESIIVKRLKYKTVEYKISAIKELDGITHEEYKDLEVLTSFCLSGMKKACGHNDDCLFVFSYNKETKALFEKYGIHVKRYYYGDE